MSNFDKSNTGSLNPTKEKFNDKSPDWYGQILITGEVLEAANAGKPISLAGWDRSGQYGNFISLKASLPREKKAGGEVALSGYNLKATGPVQAGYDFKAAEKNTPATAAPAPVSEDFEDDKIPF